MSNLSTEDGVTTEKYTVKDAEGNTLAPGTYFVIRSSDMFASAGLYAYAHTIETILELASHRPVLNKQEALYLRGVANQATQLAASWQRSGLQRVPD
jgi:hypothetical protein